MGTTEYWDIYLDYILCRVSYKCYGVLQWHQDNYINYICQLTLYILPESYFGRTLFADVGPNITMCMLINYQHCWFTTMGGLLQC